MSYFSTEKKINLSVSAMYTSAVQSLSSSYADVTIFIPSQVPTVVQLASSIGYPTITTASTPASITLEAGWKYLVEFRVKATDTTPLVGENIQYIATDTSNNQISSTGSIAILRDTAYSYTQEKCIFYADASSSAFTFKLRAIKVGGGSGGSLNTSGDAGSTNFRCHLIIKAWR
jgi:hypothetical protein